MNSILKLTHGALILMLLVAAVTVYAQADRNGELLAYNYTATSR